MWAKKPYWRNSFLVVKCVIQVLATEDCIVEIDLNYIERVARLTSTYFLWSNFIVSSLCTILCLELPLNKSQSWFWRSRIYVSRITRELQDQSIDPREAVAATSDIHSVYNTILTAVLAIISLQCIIIGFLGYSHRRLRLQTVAMQKNMNWYDCGVLELTRKQYNNEISPGTKLTIRPQSIIDVAI